jgi:hypothetical protein
MRKGLTRRLLAAVSAALAGGVVWSAARAAPIPLGSIDWDVTIPGSFGEFDIVNPCERHADDGRFRL